MLINVVMPGRLVPLVDDQIYHVFNKGIDHKPTFTDKPEHKRALTVLDFYRFNKPPLRLSKFLKLSTDDRDKILLDVRSKDEKLVEILAFCFMPNHFHFLLKQLQSNGISKFLANFQNSYTRYFNQKNERIGPLFLDQFKAVIIETDDQLLHVSRYIHLNPMTSYVVKSIEELITYPWSSFSEYINKRPVICRIDTVMDFFKKPEDYLSFVRNQADYQRKLHKIKHLIFE